MSLKDYVDYRLVKKKNNITSKKYNYFNLYSHKPYGKYTSKGVFHYDKSKVPIFDIPNSNIAAPEEEFNKKEHDLKLKIQNINPNDIENKYDSMFYLKPFIHVRVPKIENRLIEDRLEGKISNEKVYNKIRTQLLMNEDKEVRRLGLELFETEFGKSVLKEFMEINGTMTKNKRASRDFRGTKIKNYK